MRYVLGLDIGASHIKAIEGCEKGGSLFINRIGYCACSFTGFRENLVEREQDVFAKELKAFLRKSVITSNSTVSNVAGPGTVIHYFDIPKLSGEELDSAVQLEMMQVVPGGMKNLEYDYTLFPGKNGKSTVLFVGCQKNKCEFFTGALHRAGLRPLVMDHEALAIYNCFSSLNKKHRGAVFILDIGHKNTSFLLAEGIGKGFVLIRDVSFGGINLLEAIGNNKGLSAEEAMIYSGKQENLQEIKKILSADFEDLFPEVKTGMEYFRARTEISPDTLFLTGGAALMPGVCEAFEQNLDIKKAILWNPLEQLAKDSALPVPEDMKKKGPLFAVAMGLALRKIR